MTISCVRFQFSYNGTFDVAPDLSTYAFVLKQTYFESIFNISHIEYVPIGTGKFTIDVVEPICDSGTQFNRKNHLRIALDT